jgi:hypothetical protein
MAQTREHMIAIGKLRHQRNREKIADRVEEQATHSKPLTNQRQESFCMFRSTGVGVKEAYVQAGYQATKSTQTAASHLHQLPHIQARIQELLRERAEFNNTLMGIDEKVIGDEIMETGTIDKRWVLTMLVRNAQEAAEQKLYQQSTQALKTIAELMNMVPSKFGPQKEPEPKPETPELTLLAEDSTSILNLLEHMGITPSDPNMDEKRRVKLLKDEEAAGKR